MCVCVRRLGMMKSWLSFSAFQCGGHRRSCQSAWKPLFPSSQTEELQAEDLPLLSPCGVQRLGCLGWPRPASICLPSCIWQNIGAWKHVAIGNHMRDFWQQEACDIFDVCFAWGCSSYIHGVLWSKLWSPMLQVLRIMQGLFTWQSVSGSVVACSSCWWIFKESIWFADAWGCRQGVCSWLCQLCSKTAHSSAAPCPCFTQCRLANVQKTQDAHECVWYV